MSRLLRAAFAAGAALAILLVMAPAEAVSNATADTTGRYPYVGTLVLRFGSPGAYTYHYWCSGTLVAASAATPTVSHAFVANGHCFDPALQQSYFPGSVLIGLTLDSHVSTTTAPTIVATGTGYIAPGYPLGTGDLGVYRLDRPLDMGVTLPHLPAPGALATLVPPGDAPAQATIVGYGIQRQDRGGLPGIEPTDDGIRRYATEQVTTLSQFWLHLDSNTAQGQPAPCTGDSGAPRLMNGDTLLAAVTGGLGGACQSPERALRLDRPDLLAFLAPLIG